MIMPFKDALTNVISSDIIAHGSRRSMFKPHIVLYQWCKTPAEHRSFNIWLLTSVSTVCSQLLHLQCQSYILHNVIHVVPGIITAISTPVYLLSTRKGTTDTGHRVKVSAFILLNHWQKRVTRRGASLHSAESSIMIRLVTACSTTCSKNFIV